MSAQLSEHWGLVIASFVLGMATWFTLLFLLGLLIKRMFWPNPKSKQPPEPKVEHVAPERLKSAREMLNTFELLAKHGYTVVKMPNSK
jgi:hypothetical protein